MKVPGIDVRERAEIEIPLVGVVGLEIKMHVLVLIGLLHDGIFEVVALAQRAVAMVVVVHPLVDRGSLLADRFEGWVGLKKCERGRQAVVGDPIHTYFPIIVGDVFHQPLYGIVGIRGLVGGLRILEIDPGGELEFPFGLEASPQILDDEDVAILRQFLRGWRNLVWGLCGNSVGSPPDENRQRALLIDGREDHGLQVNSVAHGDHHFLELEGRRSGGFLRGFLGSGRDE